MSFDTNDCYEEELSTHIEQEQQQKQQQLQDLSTLSGTQHGFEPSLSDNENSLPKVKGKGKATRELPSANGRTPCYIQQLSLEIITHVFSHLDPVSLSTASTVCRYWRHIVTDDKCWKNAFCAYFGALPFKRLRPESWKSEYILRAHLLRKWEKGRGTAIQFNPRIGSIDAMSVDLENPWMLVASSELGMAVKCNPSTGKVDRHRLYSTDDGVPMRVSVVKIEGQRILWGFHAGFVTMTVRTKTVVGRQLKVFAEFHQGCVTALDLPAFTSDVALSASENGNIKIWDILTGTCAENLYGNGMTPTVLQVIKSFGVLSGHVDGSISYWNINVNEIVKKHREIHRRQDLMDRTAPAATSTVDVHQRLVIAAPSSNQDMPVHTIKHDAKTNVIVVSYEGCQEIFKYDLNTGNCLGVFGGGHCIGSISCMQWDLTPVTSNASLQALLQPRSKKVVPLSNGSTSEQQGTPATIKSTRLLATGDTVGTICLWDGDAADKDGSGRQIKPLRVMTGHAAAISVLFIDACKVVSGSDDGWIRIWDPLTGTLLNVLGNKVPKNAPIDRGDVNVMRVKNIFCDDYRGVATVGHQVKTWDFSPDKQLLDKRNLKPRTRLAGGADTRQLHYEIKQDLKESKEALKQEKKEREREAKELHKMTLGGLSDAELLEYALMLSKEEATAPSPQPNGSGTNHGGGSFSAGDYVEDDEALLSAVMASLDMEGNGDEATNSLPSQSAVSWKEDEWPSVNENSSPHRTSRAGSDGSVWGNVHSRVLEPFSSNTSSPRNGIAVEEDEYDEELQYVLKLSESEK